MTKTIIKIEWYKLCNQLQKIYTHKDTTANKYALALNSEESILLYYLNEIADNIKLNKR